MNILPTARASARVGALFLAFLMSDANADIGDLEQIVNLPNLGSRTFDFNTTTGRFHSIDRIADQIQIHDRNGNLLKDGSFVHSITPFNFGIEVINESTWLALSSTNELTEWSLTEDEMGNLVLTETASFNLQPLLEIGDQIRAFAYDGSGSLWFLFQNSGQTIFVQTDLSASPLGNRIEAVGSLPLFGTDGVLLDPVFEAEPLTGALILQGRSYLESFARFIYLVDPVKRELLGRFAEDNFIAGSADNAVIVENSGALEIRTAEPTLLPSLTGNAAFNPKGVLYDGSCNTLEDLYLSFSADWAGTPGMVWVVGQSDDFPFLVEETTVNGNAVEVLLEPDGSGLSNPAPTFAVMLVNAEGQINNGTPEIPGGLAIWNGGVPADGFCELWSLTAETGPQGDGVAIWSINGAWPAAPLEGTIKFDDWVPVLGGRQFGLKSLQAELKGEFKSEGDGSVTIAGGGEVAVGAGAIGVKVGAGLLTDLTETGMEYPGGTASFAFSGTVSEEANIFKAAPPLEALFALPGLNRLREYVRRVAKAQASIKAESISTFTARADNAGNLNLMGQNDIALTLALVGNAELFRKTVEVAVYGEAKAQVSYLPGDSLGQFKFKEFVLRLLTGARVAFFGARAMAEEAFVYTYTPPDKKSAGSPVVSKTISQSWDYVYGENGAAKSEIKLPQVVSENPFAEHQLQRAEKGLSLVDTAVETITGVSRDARAEVALAPDNTSMIVWVQEVAGLPPTQASNIYFSYFDGTAYSPALPIATDTFADFNPTVAYHKSGVWVALWEQVVDPNLATTGDALADALSQVENLVPAYSVFNPATRLWSAPTQMATQGTHRQMKLATGPTHDITAMWLFNAERKVLAFDVIPDSGEQGFSSLYYARFVDGAFEPISNAYTSYTTDGLGAYMDFDAADNGTEVRVAFTTMGRLYDDGLFTLADNWEDRMFLATVPIQVWYHPHDRTNPRFLPLESNFDVAAQRWGPQVLAMSDGTWRMAWQQYIERELGFGFTIPNRPSIYVTDDLTDTENARPLFHEPGRQYATSTSGPVEDCGTRSTEDFTIDCYTGTNLHEFVMADAGNGELFFVFKNAIGGSADLNLVYEDSNANGPSGSVSLTPDDALEKQPDVAIGPDGNLLISYYKANLERNEVMIDADGNGEAPFTSVDEAGTGSIVLLSHRVVTDLTVSPVTLLGGSAAGSENLLTFDVSNSGERSVQDPRVSVYVQVRGTAAKGQPELVAENLLAFEGAMPGHTKVSLSVPWTVPAEGDYEAFVIVDPDNLINEDFENNNEGPTSPLEGNLDLIFAAGFQVP